MRLRSFYPRHNGLRATNTTTHTSSSLARTKCTGSWLVSENLRWRLDKCLPSSGVVWHNLAAAAVDCVTVTWASSFSTTLVTARFRSAACTTLGVGIRTTLASDDVATVQLLSFAWTAGIKACSTIGRRTAVALIQTHNTAHAARVPLFTTHFALRTKSSLNAQLTNDQNKNN